MFNQKSSDQGLPENEKSQYKMPVTAHAKGPLKVFFVYLFYVVNSMVVQKSDLKCFFSFSRDINA